MAMDTLFPASMTGLLKSDKVELCLWFNALAGLISLSSPISVTVKQAGLSGDNYRVEDIRIAL